MSIDKKKVPLSVHEALQQYAKQRSTYYQLIPASQDRLMTFIDSEEGSDFYFSIKSHKVEQGIATFLVDYKPRSKDYIDAIQIWVKIEQLSKFFENWVACLEAYDSVVSFDDDVNFKFFEDEFFQDFEIIDEEAKKQPLTPSQILLLDDYLERIEQNIDESINESNKEAIENIKSETIELRSQIGKKTKEWVAKKLCAILAKIVKEGPILIKSIFKEAAKEVIGQGVKILIEHGTKPL